MDIAPAIAQEIEVTAIKEVRPVVLSDEINEITQYLLTMFDLQDSMNLKVNPNWQEAKYPWAYAVMGELAEAFDHTAWPWWKKSEMNLPQLQLEVIDVLHFVISDVLEVIKDKATYGVTRDGMAKGISRQWVAEYLRGNPNEGVACIRECIRAYIHATTAVNAVGVWSRPSDLPNLKLLFKLMLAAGLGPKDAFRLYVAKNVLNKFRQEHGYKTGQYIKTWMGREDNVWLDGFLKQATDVAPDKLFDFLYGRLSTQYSVVLAESQVEK